MSNQDLIDMLYKMKVDSSLKLPWKYQVVLSWCIAKLERMKGREKIAKEMVEKATATARW